MRLLLDTHLLLWAAGDSVHLSKEVRELMNAPENSLFFSPASIWEVVIKNGLGRDDFQVDPRALRRGLLENDYSELPITSEHAVAAQTLPALHKDPFDRLLVAQAIAEGITLLSSDVAVAQYGHPVRAV